MCGIFGHTMPRGLAQSRAALHALKHRGPDQWSDWHDDRVYAGHRRLSIMDLSDHGRQPMVDDTGTVIITVNGEIYNFQTLKKQLAKKYTFQSGSDSEVLLYGYREWGMAKLVTLLEGMYAFMLYDTKRDKVFLVRDRVGIKPLYYARVKEQIVWASELKAIEKYVGNGRLAIDYTGVYDYLTYLYIPAPKTMYKHVYKLEPAHYLEIDVAGQTVQDKAYWQLRVSENPVPLKLAAEQTRHLIEQSVKEQLMSDVPVGFFLSGGMDSSAVVAAASKYSKQLHTYSIGFTVAEHDETHYALMVAEQFKTTHVRKEITVSEVKKQFAKLKEWYDEPFADTSAFPTYKVSALAKPTSTVVLTGDGGDEVFGGYNWYRQFAEAYPTKKWRDKLGGQKLVTKQLADYTVLMAGLPADTKTVYRDRFDIPKDYDDYWHFRTYYRPDLPLYTRLQYMDFHTYLPGDILTKIDRASMAVALECRVPLLSTALIDFSFSLPEHIRYHNGELKGLMKLAFKDVLPAAVLERGKKGFSIPTGKWRPELMEQKKPMPEHILQALYPGLLPAKY